MHVVYPAVVSALLFAIGVYGVLARRNTILVLMSVELMLNAVNLNLVAFDVWLRDRLHSGQVLTLFVIVIAAAEVGLGLAIILALYRNRQTVDLDRLRSLSEPGDTEAAPDAGTSALTTVGGRVGRRVGAVRESGRDRGSAGSGDGEGGESRSTDEKDTDERGTDERAGDGKGAEGAGGQARSRDSSGPLGVVTGRAISGSAGEAGETS